MRWMLAYSFRHLSQLSETELMLVKHSRSATHITELQKTKINIDSFIKPLRLCGRGRSHLLLANLHFSERKRQYGFVHVVLQQVHDTARRLPVNLDGRGNVS